MNISGGEPAELLAEGLYESLRTRRLSERVAGQQELLSVFEAVDDDASPDVLARHIGELARTALAQARPEERVALANNLLQALQHPDTIHPGPQELRSLAAPAGLRRRNLRRPTTRLSDAALLTNGKDDPNLAAEIRTEMASASRVDLLCAFIRWTGLRLLEPALEELRDRGIRLRVLTSTYMGATERRAIDDLVTKYGAEVRINYETHATRLHDKAWLFRRNTGFDTAYVGSSNLSAAAMLDGLEWNVRLSSVGTPRLLQKL